MKDRISIFAALAVMMFVVLGCNLTQRLQKSISGDGKTASQNSNDNRSIADKTIDDATDDETTGVPECDQVFKTISEKTAQEAANDDSWASRATRNLIYSQIKKAIKRSIDENNNGSNTNENRKELADVCRDYQKKLETEIKKDEEKGK